MTFKLKYLISTLILFIIAVFFVFTTIVINPLFTALALILYGSSAILLVTDEKKRKANGFFRVSNLNDEVLLICDEEEKAIELMDNSVCETKVVFIAFKTEKKKNHL